jgi:hypothetical protein
MTECHWEDIRGFQSPNEFKRFEKWMSSQIEANAAKTIPMGRLRDRLPVAGEKWIECTSCGARWALAPPDPPFTGFFALVPD